MERQIRSLAAPAALFAVFAPFAFVGCSANGSVRENNRRYIVFVDLSGSVSREQRALWAKDAARLVDGLTGGSAIAVYAIHDHTLDAAPLFEDEVPDWRTDATFEVAARQKAGLVKTREGASAAIRKALESAGGAPRTDVFGAIDRVRPDPRTRPTAIYFFSDMLNSTPDLNMERQGSISRSNTGDVIRKLAQKHAWRSGLLDGVDAYCILNSVESGHNGPAIDRLTQRFFYETFFRALGARLVTYDTHLGSLAFSSSPRGEQ